MAFEIDTVATSIAGRTITGSYLGAGKTVVIKDLTAMPVEVDQRECPVLFPNPLEFVSEISVEYEAFGPGASAPITTKYTLKYCLAFDRIGTNRGLFDIYQDFIKTVKAVLTSFITTDTANGAVEIHPVSVGEFGVVADPKGNPFHGCMVNLEVTEFVN